MALLERIEKQLRVLPPDKQIEVVDFIRFLQQPLKNHAAFGSWKHRKIDAIQYQQNLRAEWSG